MQWSRNLVLNDSWAARSTNVLNFHYPLWLGYTFSRYSALPISRGHFYPNSLRKTAIAHPLGRGMTAFCDFEICCSTVCIVVLYYTVCRPGLAGFGCNYMNWTLTHHLPTPTLQTNDGNSCRSNTAYLVRNRNITWNRWGVVLIFQALLCNAYKIA